MKTVILGAKGMLGSDLIKVFKDAHAWDIDEIDITNEKRVNEKILSIRPDIVINSAAYTDVDGSESRKGLVFKVNAEAVKYLAQACNTCNAVLVHLSTDYVFDGEKKGYVEEDKPNPINVYGASKAKGEKYLLGIAKKYYLIRTAWLYGKNGKNFVDTILKLAKDKKELKVVSDQIGPPTYTKDLAEKIKEIVVKKRPYGIYHITNDGSCSWHEFAKEIVKLKKFKIKVLPIKSSELNRAAKRPKYSVLINTKTSKLRNWRGALKDYLGVV